MWNNDWIKGEDYPSWGNNEIYKQTITGGFCYQMKPLVKHIKE